MKNFYVLFSIAIVMIGLPAGCGEDKTIPQEEPVEVVVKTLTRPANTASFELGTIEQVVFEWVAASASTRADGVTYEVLFDSGSGDFSVPIHRITSDDNGTANKATVSGSVLTDIARKSGAGEGETASLKWSVNTREGGKSLLSEKSRTITLVRPGAELISRFTVGEDLFIGGAGSEAGQKFKFVQDGTSQYYEIYTGITANGPYYFYSGENDGDGAKFVVNQAGGGFSEVEATSSAGATRAGGIYRIRLNFATKAVTFDNITKVAIRYAINYRDATLTYQGRGTWKAEHYNIQIRRENWGVEVRYRFYLVIDEKTEEFWGNGGGVPAATDGDRPMTVVGSDMWSGVWDYPSALRDNNNFSRYYTDVVLNMNTKNSSYTHNFENWRDSEIYYNGDRAIPEKSVWEAAADSITFTLIDQFMNKSRGTFWGSAGNVLNNSDYLYWQQAYPIHTMLHSYERIKNTDPGLAAQYKNYVSLWIANNGNNWYGDKRNGFHNEYTDDMAWMALVFLHMYEIWGEATHLNYAREIYGYMTESHRVRQDATGWGLIWNSNSGVNGWNSRNACTNTPAIIAAAKLYRITGTQQYLDEALKMYDYMIASSTVGSDGRVEEPPLTYTQGCWIEGCRLLYHITGESKYIDNATKAVSYTMTSGRCIDGAGLLRDEGSSGDQSNFKGGFMPYMVNYINDASMPDDMRQQARTFMIKNARFVWFHNMDKSLYPKTFTNFSFHSVYRVAGNPGSLGAHNSGAALIEGITRIL